MPDDVTSRPAVAADRPFLVDLYAETRAAELAGVGWDPATLRVFLEQQYGAREAGWAAVAPDRDDAMLLCGERPIGRLVLDRRADGVSVVDIALLTRDQGRGTGTAVLEALLAEADAAGVPVRLHVAAGNPARRLYERLGFFVTGSDEVYLAMERPAAGETERATSAQASTAT